MREDEKCCKKTGVRSSVLPYLNLQKDWKIVIIKWYYSLHYGILYFGVGRKAAHSGKCSYVHFEADEKKLSGSKWKKKKWCLQAVFRESCHNTLAMLEDL